MQDSGSSPASAAGTAAADRLGAFAAEIVAVRWPAASVVSIDAMRGDASSRAYRRVQIRPGDSKAPASLVAMLLADSAVALSSEELGVFGDDGPTELPFISVARYLDTITDALPRIEAQSPEGDILLLEDVGDLTLWAAASADPAGPLPWFTKALEWLAELQGQAKDDGSGCTAFAQTFDERLFQWEFQHFIEYGVANAPAALVAEASAELQEIAQQLAALPTLFCHRDFHAWNLHAQGDRLRVIDFQDALLAPALYDVASLLTDRCTPTLITPALEDQLIVAYHNAASGDGPVDATRQAYTLCALQRTLKVVGRFNYLADVKGKPEYRDMLGDVVASARRMLDKVPSLVRSRELFDGFVCGPVRPA